MCVCTRGDVLSFSDSDGEDGNSLVAAPEDIDEDLLASGLLQPDDDGEPVALNDDSDDSDDDGPAAASDSEDELPDGWIDPKISEQKAQVREKQKEEEAKKRAALALAAKDVSLDVAVPEADGHVTPPEAASTNESAGMRDGAINARCSIKLAFATCRQCMPHFCQRYGYFNFARP